MTIFIFVHLLTRFETLQYQQVIANSTGNLQKLNSLYRTKLPAFFGAN